MARVADSTIKGFIYQFNVTLEKILSEPSEKIQVEGILEDIDIVQKENLTAVQCKYHESVKKYSLSDIRKPILQMIKTDCIVKTDFNISYILYAYFPALSEGIQEFKIDDLIKVFKTEDESLLINYIAHIIEIDDDAIQKLINKKRKNTEDKTKIKKFILNKKFDYSYKINLDAFLKKFTFCIGKQLGELQKHTCDLLIKTLKNVSNEDIRDMIYPNAIQKIANLSTLDDDSRFIIPEYFLKDLLKIKTTAITRWTKELFSYERLLKRMRDQLYINLNKNYQERLFIMDPSDFENFNDEIVQFLKDFCELYCHKPQLHIPPTFCILDYKKDDIEDVISRLYKFNISVENGFQGREFFPESFFRKPIFNHKDDSIEFRLRISVINQKFIDALNRNKPDIIYSISDSIPSNFDTRDVRVEFIDVKTIKDLEYVLSMKRGVC